MKNIYWIIVFIILSTSCSDKSNQTKLSKGEDYPDQESWGVTIILTDSSIERARASTISGSDPTK